MKKSRSMRLASALLVLTLLSTCMISGTFAKYVSQSSASDSARVAKWGVELQVAGNLYGDTYTNEIVKEAQDEGANIRVQSVDKSADVVAPGTENNEGLTFKIQGTPEVDYDMTLVAKMQNIYLEEGTYGVMVPVDGVTEINFGEYTDLNVLYTKTGETYVEAEAFVAGGEYYTLEDECVNDAAYYPVVYKLGTKLDSADPDFSTQIKYDSTNTDQDSLYDIFEVIQAYQTGVAREYVDPTADNNMTRTATFKFNTGYTKNANTSLAAAYKLGAANITWKWAFEAEKDGQDTILGHLIAGNDFDAQVVVKDESVNTTTYVALNKNGNGQLALAGEKVYACLNTSLDLDITVTQVD